MDWVKRNLGFVIGTVVAVGLLLFSGFYLYSNSKKNNDAREQLAGEYNELQRLSNLKPHPGKGNVDNIRRAKQQNAELRRFMQKVGQHFEPIPAIPPAAQVTGEDFSASLRRTIERLNRRARVSSVIVPTNYNFSFEAEKRLVKFAPNSLNRLAVQLGEVKAISDILFAAKVNKLTALRRERVSPDDRTGPQSDYLSRSSVTNDLAVISPYEISFESFSAELAEVISGFANSPHGIVIKGLNVQPARALASAVSPYGTYGGRGFMGEIPMAPSGPIYTAPPAGAFGGEFGGMPGGEYGGMPGGEFGGAPGGGSQIRRPTFNRPALGGEATRYGGAPTPRYESSRYGQPNQAQPYAQAYGQPGAGAATAGAQTLIDEHPLAVTMVVEVIKLLPAEEE